MPQAINALISGLPLQLHDGSVGRVTARIPLPNPLTSSVGLSLESLHLTFHIIPDVSGSPALDASHLAESVASLADAFIHEELTSPEEASLRESFYSELSESTNSLPEHLPGGLDPFSVDETPRGDGEPPGVSLFATLVERLLSRFAFDAIDTKITVVHPERASFTLSIPEIRYGADEQNPPTFGNSSLEGVARSVSLSGVSVTTRLLLPPTAQPQSSGSSQDAPTINVPSGRTSPDRPPPPSPLSDSSEMDEDTQLLMSQSIVSLPPRPVSPTNSVSSSMYESAISSSPKEDIDPLEDNVEKTQPSRSLTPPLPVEDSPQPPPFLPSSLVKPIVNTDLDDLEDELILSFGTEPILIRIVTPSPSHSDPPSQTFDTTSPFRQHPDSKGKQSSSTGALHVSVRTPVIASALRAQNIRSLIDVADAFASHSPSSNKGKVAEAPKPTASLFDHVDGNVQIRGVVIILHQQTSAKANLETFFAHPLVPPRIHQGYVRVWMEGWNASFSLQNEPADKVAQSSHTSCSTRQLTASFSLSELSVFAFLRPDRLNSSTELHASPILITDPYLGMQYSNSHVHPTLDPYDHQGTLPIFDVMDWTDPVHLPDSTKLSHWRTRPHKSTSRGTTTQRREGPSPSSPQFNSIKSTSPRSPIFSSPSTTPRNTSDALSRPRHPAVSVKLTSVSSSRISSRPKRNNSVSSSHIAVKLAPLHVFIDAALCLEGDTPSTSSTFLSFVKDLASLKPESPQDEFDDEGSDVGDIDDLDEGLGTPRAGTPFRLRHQENEQERERKRLERLVLDDLDLGFDYTQETPTKKKPEPDSPTRSRSHRKVSGVSN